MKYKCCEYLLHQIVFDPYDIKPCCETSMNKNVIKFSDDFEGNFNINQYIQIRKSLTDKFKKGEIPTACENCPIIKEKEWDDDIYLDRIIMGNIAKCSCNCIYCVYTHDNQELKKYYNTKNNYDIRPILMELRNNNLINKDFVLIIGGGECSEFPSGMLEWLIYFTSFYNGKIQLLSSGINYSPAIEKILKTGKAELCISPDAGTKKTYEKIKRVKAFDRVWNNLKKYVAAAGNSENSRVEIKYIIIPSVNDTLKEAKSFIRQCKRVNCKNLHIDIEHYWFRDNKETYPENIKNIVNFFKDQTDFCVSFSVETEYWFNKMLISKKEI